VIQLNFCLKVFSPFFTESQIFIVKVEIEQRINLQLTGKISLKLTSAQVCFPKQQSLVRLLAWLPIGNQTAILAN